MEFIFILIAIILFPILYFRGSRLFKKKSHHYIIPPDPNKDPNWHPIEIAEYHLHIFIRNSETDPQTIINDGFPQESESEPLFKISSSYKHDSWSILGISDISFEGFTTLVWYLSTEEGTNPDFIVIGYCQHFQNSLNDFIIRLEADDPDHFIGSFRNGQNFGIYLPKSGIEKTGNMSLTRNKEISFDEVSSILPMSLLNPAR